MKNKNKWENISLYTKIADINMKKKKIDGFQLFKTCLKNVKDNNPNCQKYNCIIAKLIKALIKRGAKL